MRSSRKASRFSAKQKTFLEVKFKVGEHTAFKADPAQMAQDMGHGNHEYGAADQSL